MAEQKTTARAMITKTAHIGPIRRDFEVRGIAQRYTVIQELNIVRWWHVSAGAVGVAFPGLVFEKVSQNCRRATAETPEESRTETKNGDGSERLRSLSQLEVIVSPSLDSRGTLDLVHYLPDGTSRIIGRFTWKTPVKSRKYSRS